MIGAGEFGGDVEAEAEAVGLAVVRFVATEEAFEKAWLDLGGNGSAILQRRALVSHFGGLSYGK